MVSVFAHYENKRHIRPVLYISLYFRGLLLQFIALQVYDFYIMGIYMMNVDVSKVV
jgi:hypothetical protein